MVSRNTIPNGQFKELPDTLFKDVLERVVEYGLTDHLMQEHEISFFWSKDYDPEHIISRFEKKLVDDAWSLVQQEQVESIFPALVTQKESAIIIVAAARAGNKVGVTIAVTADTRNDTASGYKTLKGYAHELNLISSSGHRINELFFFITEKN
nr:hypothetical protein [Candidatus Sigynarchaeota archaeon]